MSKHWFHHCEVGLEKLRTVSPKSSLEQFLIYCKDPTISSYARFSVFQKMDTRKPSYSVIIMMTCKTYRYLHKSYIRIFSRFVTHIISSGILIFIYWIFEKIAISNVFLKWANLYSWYFWWRKYRQHFIIFDEKSVRKFELSINLD